VPRPTTLIRWVQSQSRPQFQLANIFYEFAISSNRRIVFAPASPMALWRLEGTEPGRWPGRSVRPGTVVRSSSAKFIMVVGVFEPVCNAQRCVARAEGMRSGMSARPSPPPSAFALRVGNERRQTGHSRSHPMPASLARTSRSLARTGGKQSMCWAGSIGCGACSGGRSSSTARRRRPGSVRRQQCISVGMGGVGVPSSPGGGV
jgi:hypothetical protein